MELEQSFSIQHKVLKGLTLPIAKLDVVKMTMPLLEDSTYPNKFENKQDELPKSRIKKGFDHIVYKLLVKARYNFKDSTIWNTLPPQTAGKKVHGLNPIQ